MVHPFPPRLNEKFCSPDPGIYRVNVLLAQCVEEQGCTRWRYGCGCYFTSP